MGRSLDFGHYHLMVGVSVNANAKGKAVPTAGYHLTVGVSVNANANSASFGFWIREISIARS